MDGRNAVGATAVNTTSSDQASLEMKKASVSNTAPALVGLEYGVSKLYAKETCVPTLVAFEDEEEEETDAPGLDLLFLYTMPMVPKPRGSKRSLLTTTLLSSLILSSLPLLLLLLLSLPVPTLVTFEEEETDAPRLELLFFCTMPLVLHNALDSQAKRK
jgi:hypothetical protein